MGDEENNGCMKYVSASQAQQAKQHLKNIKMTRHAAAGLEY